MTNCRDMLSNHSGKEKISARVTSQFIKKKIDDIAYSLQAKETPVILQVKTLK